MIYDYTSTRERAGPEKFLKDFRGHLQADAYVVYDSFFTDPARGLVEVGCWAHARRHFHNALEQDPAHMGGVLAMIAHLYEVEQAGRKNGWCGEDLRLLRERQTRPMLNQLHDYLLTIRVAAIFRCFSRSLRCGVQLWLTVQPGRKGRCLNSRIAGGSPDSKHFRSGVAE